MFRTFTIYYVCKSIAVSPSQRRLLFHQGVNLTALHKLRQQVPSTASAMIFSENPKRAQAARGDFNRQMKVLRGK